MSANSGLPRIKSQQEAAEFGAKILVCFDSFNKLTAVQVAELVGDEYKFSRVRQRLCRMVQEGVLHSELVRGTNSPNVAIYGLGPSDSPPQKKEQHQRIVRKWKPDGKPDPLGLPMAFFAPQQRNEQ